MLLSQVLKHEQRFSHGEIGFQVGGGESTVNKEPELLGCDMFSNLPPFVRLECQV